MTASRPEPESWPLVPSAADLAAWSAAAVLLAPVVRYVSARTMVDSLGELGVTRIGAVSRGGTPPGRLEISQPARAILIGSEAFGLPEEIVSELEHRVSIPMSSQVDSYSANAAAAILLYALAT